MTSWLLLPLLLLAFAPHVQSFARKDLASYTPPHDFYSNPEKNAQLKGWQVNDPIETNYPKRLVMLKNIQIDAYCNVIISVMELSEERYQKVLRKSKPYPDCPYSIIPQVATIQKVEIMFMEDVMDFRLLAQAVFHSEEIKELAEAQQDKIFKKQGIYHPCPHSFQIVFQNIGTVGHRTLRIQDLFNFVPAHWAVDILYDQQRDQLLIISNQCGHLFSFPPGATVNIGATAWLYDPDTRKVLTLKKMSPRQEEYTVKPGGNLDIVNDRLDLTLHPYYNYLTPNTRRKLQDGFVDWTHAAFRELIEETGLYDPKVVDDVGPELIEKFLNTQPKLLHVEDWLGNPIAPSVNFHIVYKVKGISQLNTAHMKLAREEGVISAQFDDVSPEDLYAIKHAMTIHLPSSFDSNFSTRPVPY